MNGIERAWVRNALSSLEDAEKVAPNLHTRAAISRLEIALSIEANTAKRKANLMADTGMTSRPKNPTGALRDERAQEVKEKHYGL